VAGAVVDVAVLFQALLLTGIEGPNLARDRRDETEGEGGQGEDAQDDDEGEKPKLADPAPRSARRGRGSSSQAQNRGIVTLRLGNHGGFRPHS
jgi:hypothetical protein